MAKYVCIHAHFYQPPRENPWLEAVEYQETAHPYHDWNERITAECYGPNSASRVLNPEGRIIGIMNNYSRISFNFGPTLLSWMELAQPEIYAAILEADRISQKIHGGHGSAIAQVYNHMIMPLASSRDKRTQISWGIRDFVHRFGRYPEGMWLAETAVDLETLELLAEREIRFTILAPRQAARVRSLSEGQWREVGDESIDPKHPYLCRLPSGRSIVIFFYDGPISRELAFEGLLQDGVDFAERLLGAATSEDENQLIHIATDGETYGHHHRKGEMALTYCLYHIEDNRRAEITIYGEYLERHPPTTEVQIIENSSWSCIHGIERWREACGCNSGGSPGWQQDWRQPLREALDWLRDRFADIFEELAAPLLVDPWVAREQYITVMLDRSAPQVMSFLKRETARSLSDEERSLALRLLEMQRQAMLMYTSCGWFFDEISGIETTQILKYASRAIQLARQAGGPDLEREFAQRLGRAPSNIAEHQNGAVIFEQFVLPAKVGIKRFGAHYAISALFEDIAAEDSINAFQVTPEFTERLQAGKFRLAIGRISVLAMMIWERTDLSYAVLHLGDQNIGGGVREFVDAEAFAAMHSEIKESFEGGDIQETIRRLDQHFGDQNYSLWHLFRDKQREIIGAIFGEIEQQIEAFYRQVYQEHYHLLQSMVTLSTPMPPVLRSTIEFLVNLDLRRCLQADTIDEEQFSHLLSEVEKWSVAIDKDLLGLLGSRHLDQTVARLWQTPLDYELLSEIARHFDLYCKLDLPLNIWRAQNTLYEIGQQQFFLRSRMAERGADAAASWVKVFKRVAHQLGVRFD